jgi:hypothetical protein
MCAVRHLDAFLPDSIEDIVACHLRYLGLLGAQLAT